MLIFEKDGAMLICGALSLNDLIDIESVFKAFSLASAGAGISTQILERFNFFAAIRLRVSDHLGPNTRAVRAILFDKNKTSNWALGWHQDRTISVKARKEVNDFGPWTIKAGTPHVAPPITLVAKMITVRVHLDSVDEQNAPLLIAPGSHQRGFIAERDIEAVVAACGQHVCIANAGDVWLYATPILHASERAAHPRRRRVLQIDYSAENLPGGLEWAADA